MRNTDYTQCDKDLRNRITLSITEIAVTLERSVISVFSQIKRFGLHESKYSYIYYTGNETDLPEDYMGVGTVRNWVLSGYKNDKISCRQRRTSNIFYINEDKGEVIKHLPFVFIHLGTFRQLYGSLNANCPTVFPGFSNACPG